MPREQSSSWFQRWSWPLLIGFTATAMVYATSGCTWLATIKWLSAPGLTSDEPFSVLYGWEFIQQLHRHGRQFFTKDTIDNVFGPRSEHPPLGRWLIGAAAWFQSDGQWRGGPVRLEDGRLAPAIAFGLMVALVAGFVTARLGRGPGIAAGVGLVLMPRLFAHAHFAALDTLVACTSLLSILSARWMLSGGRSLLRAVPAGVFLGMAMLTKIHGLLLLPVVVLWAVAAHRWRGLATAVVWALVGVTVFFAGWPWLWSDLERLYQFAMHGLLSGEHWARNVRLAMPHLTQFLSSSVQRQVIFVPYFNHIYRDAEVPWHYPWVMSALTMPVLLLAVALLGFAAATWQLARKGRKVPELGGEVRPEPGRQKAEAAERAGSAAVEAKLLAGQGERARPEPTAGLGLILLAAIYPLLVFSVPAVPVYDGVRLFLMAFPFWAILIGYGVAALLRWLTRWSLQRSGAVFLSGLFATQAYGVIYYHPVQLSYYNALVGGLSGAERLGLELTYWGDSLTREFLDRWARGAERGATALIAPSLYDVHAQIYQTPWMKRKQLRLSRSTCEQLQYLIVFNRRAYLGPMRKLMDRSERQLVLERDGVWLSAVYRVPPDLAEKGAGGRLQPRSE